jgi:hypothetical protein
MGRPVELSGGRVDGAPPSVASPETERCVGRIVVGPLGDAMRDGAGFTTGARLRTTLGSGAAGAVGVSWAGVTSSPVLTMSAALVTTRLTRAGASRTSGSATTAAAAAFVAPAALVALVALVALAALAASSG